MNVIRALLITAIGTVFLFLATTLYTQAQKDPGKDLFQKYKCAKCHTINALKISQDKSKDTDEEEDEDDPEVKQAMKKPKDLSDVGKERNAEWLSKWLTKQQAKEDPKTKKQKKHKKKFKGNEAELKTLSGWLSTLKYGKNGKKT